MEPRHGEDSLSFNLLLSPELKEQVDFLSARLGMPQRDFIEWAIRAYLSHLQNQDELIFPHPSPLAFLQNLQRITSIPTESPPE